jgi:soluble lytic murein transglycosylase-like protein
MLDNIITAGGRRVNKQRLMQLSNIIYKYAKKYKLDPKLLTAILAQESMYRINTANCSYGIRCCDFTKVLGLETNKVGYDVVRSCTDFGISQIHYKTAERYNLDIALLLTDPDYSVRAGAKILYDIKRRYAKHEPTWWTRYNASSPSKRAEYEKKVMRFFPIDETKEQP